MITHHNLLLSVAPWWDRPDSGLRQADMDWFVKLTRDGVYPEGSNLAPIIGTETHHHSDDDEPEEVQVAVKPADNSSGRLIPWGQRIIKIGGREFLDSILWVEDVLKLSADALIPCMMFESKLDPKARNPVSTASGLIQFMESTAKRLGTTIQAIRSMDALSQMNYVYKYFRGFGSDLSKWDYADCYMAILWPAGVGKPMDYRLWARGSTQYGVNSGLDKNKDGQVTKAECAQKIQALLSQGMLPENVLKI